MAYAQFCTGSDVFTGGGKSCFGNIGIGVNEERQGIVYFREFVISEFVVRNFVIINSVIHILSLVVWHRYFIISWFVVGS